MKFGVTQSFDCNYLPNEKEKLLVCMEPVDELSENYSSIIQVGFRRSGEQLYRPHCATCSACESLRILTELFVPSKSQKRVLIRNKNIDISVSEDERDDYYALYEKYIAGAHKEGSMYPASYEQYRNFIQCTWQSPLFVEGRIDGKLVGVAVTDRVNGGLSALYTYFDTDMSKHSLGTFFILQQILICQKEKIPYLYLGYQIDQCNKMSYKNKFYPHQRYRDNKWKMFTTK